MISIEDALILISNAIQPLHYSEKKLIDSLGKVLSENIVAPIDLPPFDQSAMDGYAVKFGKNITYNIVGAIKAGDDASEVVLKENEAIKIFTGAFCPSSADAVCQIEHISKNDDATISLHPIPLVNANIRRQGEQIQKGTIALEKGHVLTPASIGFLANLGFDKVITFDIPRVSIIATGSELVAPGGKLSVGKIYESNSIMLQAVLKREGIEEVTLSKTIDDLVATVETIKTQLQLSDILIISGGISVGDHDYVSEALQKNGVKEIFHKVNQKPGKPFYFGTKNNKLIFALPGNPAAALTCFYIYIVPALRKMMGGTFETLDKIEAICQTTISKPNSRAQFLKAKYKNGNVKILEGQSSAMLHTFSESNALVYLPANSTVVLGDKIQTYLF